MKTIGIFYGPAEGSSTEKVAYQVAEQIGENKVDLIPVKNATFRDLNKYSNLIFGISTVGKETWDGEAPPGDWDQFRIELDKTDFQNKVVAMFSLGDHITYPRHFADALGTLAEKLLPRKAKIVGYVNTEEYDFEESQGIYEGKFIGLPIDEDFEAHLTDERIRKWLDKILPQFV
ncbi:MAG: flavodoxin [Bacteroidales bacterium]|nr:flavodoxin [Bacteroidales bacterium]MBS3774484.1 flavodoxin [Bacteroidales bacterium]